MFYCSCISAIPRSLAIGHHQELALWTSWKRNATLCCSIEQPRSQQGKPKEQFWFNDNICIGQFTDTMLG